MPAALLLDSEYDNYHVRPALKSLHWLLVKHDFKLCPLVHLAVSRAPTYLNDLSKQQHQYLTGLPIAPDGNNDLIIQRLTFGERWFFCCRRIMRLDRIRCHQLNSRLRYRLCSIQTETIDLSAVFEIFITRVHQKNTKKIVTISSTWTPLWHLMLGSLNLPIRRISRYSKHFAPSASTKSIPIGYISVCI